MSPWLTHAGLATAILGWSPETFWNATPHEFRTAWVAYLRVRGLDPEPARLGRQEFESLMEHHPDVRNTA